MQTVRSTCPYCGVGCGLKIKLDGDKPLVLGDEEHPANFGRLCSKGSALAGTISSDAITRLSHPEIDGKAVGWEQATGEIADRITQSIEQHGRDSVAFYLSGQLLTEDYYVANKLMKGFIGTANVDTNSRLCMSSAVAGYKRAFGSDTVPCSYEDLDQADLIVLVGSNAAWTHPVLYQRMVAAKAQNPNLKVVSIDPRKTATNELVDLHLAITPSSDGFLFQGLLNFLVESNAIDQDYIQQSCDGYEAAKETAELLTLDVVAAKAGVQVDELKTFYQWFSVTKKAISFYSQGVNQSATGTDKCNAIINCHLASGKIGYAGAGPFSITGQPNAMGGREVGGLSNQLAAHMDFADDDKDRVQRFWRSPAIAGKPGLKAVELFDAVASGKIKVIWIMATNPAVSLPSSNKVRQALALCPTVIVSDVTHTDTTAYADILLPAKGWGEKDGTVTNSERRISRQRQFVVAPEQAKADWWAVCEVAKKMGFASAFSYQNAHSIFLEHARLSEFENNGTRDFDISGLSDLSLDDYAQLSPVQWPVNKKNPKGSQRMFEDGRFYTNNGKARFISAKTMLAECIDSPFILNTGRLRDQWHTMTRTGSVPSLSAHDDIPSVQINVADAECLHLKAMSFARIHNAYGEFIARVEPGEAVKQGQLFSSIHWNKQFAMSAAVSAVVSPEVDPVSGQPESKASAVSIEAFDCAQWARVASLKPLDKTGFQYWAQTKCERGYITVIGVDQIFDWRAWTEKVLIPAPEQKLSFTEYADPVNAAKTICAASNLSLEVLIFARQYAEQLPSYTWLADMFERNDAGEVVSILRAEPDGPDARICSCFGTTRKSIEASIGAGRASVAELGVILGCGSKCGSCKPELAALLG